MGGGVCYASLSVVVVWGLDDLVDAELAFYLKRFGIEIGREERRK